ncbi:hypothetical protein [Ruegeria lacuscaerulensis]|uniref:hypothetical protein n=1 Tax=Ruegeria lacuscaerulensis TaxID=55218 RepID=UPI00147A2851|nr:hypothetical protein [Ruegeria lacuscaerulensis]
MRFRKMPAIAAIVLLPGVAQAIGFGVNLNPAVRVEVADKGNGIYEVSTRGTTAPVAYWCGIGDYAIRTLRTKATQRIYITRAYEKQTRTVQFSLTPPEGVDTTPGYSVTVKRVGENLSAGSAQTYCYDNFLDFGF